MKGRVNRDRGSSGETLRAMVVLFLDEELVEIFKEVWRNRRFGCEYVFQRNGKPVNDLRFPWKKACAKAGVSTMIFHDLRRTAVRNLIRSGVPEAVVMRITGHKTRAVFDRYNIVSERDLKEASIAQETYLENETATKTATVVDLGKK